VDSGFYPAPVDQVDVLVCGGLGIEVDELAAAHREWAQLQAGVYPCGVLVQLTGSVDGQGIAGVLWSQEVDEDS